MTSIEWTDETWNPVTGCSRVSPGCANCYIERTPPFRMAGRRFERLDGASTTGVTLHPDRLDKPLRWRKPRRVFVCSLADLFHDDVPDHFIAGVFAIMSQARQHTFQVLTKRPERARDLLCRWRDVAGLREPLPNVWLGVSIENARYTWRADVLRAIPAAVRFISAEPLLGSLFPHDPNQGRPDDSSRETGETGAPAFAVRAATAHQVAQRDDEASPAREHDPSTSVERRSRSSAPLDLTGIDWVIVGGESGPGARPFHLEHAREIIAACREHDVAPFVKQLGASPLATWEVDGHPCSCRQFGIRDRKGGDITEWPADLQVREFPETRVAA